MKVSDHIAQFLRTRNLSTKDIQIVVDLVRELEEVVVERKKTIEAARTALQQQSQAIRALTDNFLERQERRRELQGQASEDRRPEVARAGKDQSEGALKGKLQLPSK